MIYPSIHHILCQYRGPRFSTELNKFFVSMSHDITIAYDTMDNQGNILEDINNFNINGQTTSQIAQHTVVSIENVSDDTPTEYKSLNQLTSSLDSITAKLKKYKENIY